MAVFNESLESRFSDVIRRLHGLKGGAAPIQVAPEITHDITLENDRPEALYLSSTHLFDGSVSSLAAVGFVSVALVRNPSNSGILAVVTNIRVVNSSAGILGYEIHTRPVGSTPSTFVNHRDTRRGGAAANVGALGLVGDNVTFATAAAYSSIIRTRQLAPAGSCIDVESVPYILTPGNEVAVVGSLPNTGPVQANFSGYYRALAASDLHV